MSLDINFFSIVSIALLSSFSHCIGMCGGFFTLCAINIKKKNRFYAIYLTLVYHIGRVCSYMTLGALFGSFGSFFALSKNSRATMFFIVGLVLVFIGVALLKRGKMLKIIENDRISKFIMQRIVWIRNFPDFFKFLSFGVLNGLVPCGVVYYFLAMSIASSSALSGAIVMMIFGFSTFPTMISFGIFLKFITEKFKNIAFKILVLGIILNGIYLAFLGFMANG